MEIFSINDSLRNPQNHAKNAWRAYEIMEKQFQLGLPKKLELTVLDSVKNNHWLFRNHCTIRTV